MGSGWGSALGWDLLLDGICHRMGSGIGLGICYGWDLPMKRTGPGLRQARASRVGSWQVGSAMDGIPSTARIPSASSCCCAAVGAARRAARPGAVDARMPTPVGQLRVPGAGGAPPRSRHLDPAGSRRVLLMGHSHRRGPLLLDPVPVSAVPVAVSPEPVADRSAVRQMSTPTAGRGAVTTGAQ
jgi:hypothetical protein